mgnify:CR=1 FL=1|jgi:hypothetical protein
MRSSDWLPIETAPLNPYGQAYGPVILLWSTAGNDPVAGYYDCQGGPDNKPRWVSTDSEEMWLEDVSHWMPIAAPWPTETSDPDRPD